MNVNRTRRKTGIVLVALAFAGLFIAKSQTIEKQEFDVVNPNWRQEGKFVYISYELMGPVERNYEVKLVLRNDENKFEFVPRAVGGDIGKIVGGTKDRAISWDLEKDFPKGLDGEGYYFEIGVSIQKTGGFPWLLASGATVVVAVGMYYFRDDIKEWIWGKETEANGSPAGLPMPPATRPTNQ